MCKLRDIGVNEATVRRFRQRFARNPELLLELGLSEMVGRARDDEYRCLVCGDQLIGRLPIERHVLRHFVDEAATQETLQLGGAGTEPTASTAAGPASDALYPLDQEITSSPGADRRLYNRLQQPTAEALPPRQDQHTAGTQAPSQQLPLIAQGPISGHDAAVEDVHSAPEQSGQPTERPQDATATSDQSTAPADRKDIQPTPRLRPERPQFESTEHIPEPPAQAPQPQIVDTTSRTQQPDAPARVPPQPPADEDTEKRRQEFELLRQQATDQGRGGPPPPTRTPEDATPQTADSESRSPEAGPSAGDRQEIERLVGEPVMFELEGKPGEPDPRPAGLNEVLLQMDPSPGGPGETSTQGRDVPDSSEWHHAFQRLAAERGKGEEASKVGPEASSAGTDASRDTGNRGDLGQLGGTGEHPGPGAESAQPGTSAPDEKASQPTPNSSEWHQAFESLAAQRGQGEQWEGSLYDQEPIASKGVSPPKPDEPAAGDPEGDANQEWEDEL